MELFRPILIAHELGLVYFTKIAMMSGFQELEVLEKELISLWNTKQIYLQLSFYSKTKNVLETLNEYATFFETASILNVPAALLDFKFAISA